MNAKSSAHYQREFRKRLREQGLVKKEIWIRPEHARQLSELEQMLRRSNGSVDLARGTTMNNDNDRVWTTLSLFAALREKPGFSDGEASVKLIDGIEPSLQVDMHEFGELPIFVTVFGEQIICEAVLWPASDVTDTGAFNDTVLRTHKYFPLSTISLDRLGDGQTYYQMFGALSATSRIENVLYEIDTLARNVIQATEAYGEYLAVTENA